MTRLVDCPTCGTKVPWSPESRFRPFCSERCKVIDLGDWAAERHVIAGGAPDITEEGAPESSPPAPGAASPQRRG